MPIPKEIMDLLPEFGAPVGAIALAVGLVRGAGALEKDASAGALKYVSDLLKGGDVTSLGKLGATLIPAVFDRIFGSRPLSYKFISRSFIATTIFWTILLAAKHPSWSNVWQSMIADQYLWVLIPLWYVIDWLSLLKAKFVMRIISNNYALMSTLLFFLIDMAISFSLPLLAAAILSLLLKSTDLNEFIVSAPGEAGAFQPVKVRRG